MGAFEFQALDEGGKSKKGVLEGDNARQIRQQIREKGWTPVQIEEVKTRRVVVGEKSKESFFMGKGLSAADLSLVTRQLATLVKSSLPLEEALQTVSQQTDKAKIKSMVLSVRSRLLEGHTLAKSLAEYPQAFPDYYRATIAAGEQSGHLDLVLERLADYTESGQTTADSVQGALLYPIILVVLAILVVGGLLTFIVPKVVQVFDNIGQELPLLTRVLIAISDFTKDYGLFVIVLMVILAIVAKKLLRQDKPKEKFHGFLLRVPLVSRLVRGMNTARFARTFSILASSGVPVLEGLRISAEVMSNIPMKKAVLIASDRVREGSTLRAALESSKCFPPLTIHLIAAGEASGKLEEMLERAASHQEREMQSLITTLLNLLEPILLVTVGLMVLAIVLAILLPILNMNQMVG